MIVTILPACLHVIAQPKIQSEPFRHVIVVLEINTEVCIGIEKAGNNLNRAGPEARQQGCDAAPAGRPGALRIRTLREIRSEAVDTARIEIRRAIGLQLAEFRYHSEIMRALAPC